MDKLVRRVTVVEHSGQRRKTKVVYNNNEDDEDKDDDYPHFYRLERSVRHMLKAQVMEAQEAYQRHLDSAGKGGDAWLYDGPRNLMRARRKAMKEMRLAGPFGIKVVYDEDQED